jgi:uncharacterized protein (TIGR03382 family)
MARRMILSRFAPLLGLGLALAAPRPAAACSAPACWPGYFTPGDATSVPANLPAIYWRPMTSVANNVSLDLSLVVLTTVADPATPLAFTTVAQPNGDYLIVPTAPLVAGTDYTIADHNACGTTEDAGPRVTFHAVAEAPLPTSLGTLAIVDHDMATFQVGTSSGSCYSDVLADQARLELTPSADVVPWKDAMHFHTLADGHPWGGSTNINATSAPGSSWVGRAVDRLYHTCATDDDGTFEGLTTGAHQIAMTATLPGSAVSLDASAVALDLECPANGSGSGSDVVQPIEDGCNAGGAAGPLALLALLGLVRRKRA